MNRTNWLPIILLSILIFLAGFLVGTLLSNRYIYSNPSTEKIENIQNKVDSIYVVKDSIKERIDTVYLKLESNNKQYEKDVNRVINNDVNEDRMFFLKYINSNRARLDSISNSF